jgi:hypothetical protein
MACTWARIAAPGRAVAEIIENVPLHDDPASANPCRRTAAIGRVMLAALVVGLSTRKVGEALLAMLGRPISAGTVNPLA